MPPCTGLSGSPALVLQRKFSLLQSSMQISGLIQRSIECSLPPAKRLTGSGNTYYVFLTGTHRLRTLPSHRRNSGQLSLLLFPFLSSFSFCFKYCSRRQSLLGLFTSLQLIADDKSDLNQSVKTFLRSPEKSKKSKGTSKEPPKNSKGNLTVKSKLQETQHITRRCLRRNMLIESMTFLPF